MKYLKDVDFFSEMPGTSFSFQALTKIWMGISSQVPDEIKNNLAAVRNYVLAPENAVARELDFTGTVTIARGAVDVDSGSGAKMVRMHLEEMEEYGYSAELDTTFKLSARKDLQSIGYTRQEVAGLDAGSEARILLNLEIDAIHGALSGTVAKATCTTKKAMAPVSAFPFTGGQTVFRHVDSKALEVGQPGSPIAYIAYGIMIPLHPLDSGPSKTLSVADDKSWSSYIDELPNEDRNFINFV